jgi:hypothetical protein
MTDKIFPKSGLPIRRSVELLPITFQTESNDKFLSAVLDPLIQPGVLDKVSGYIGRRTGKTYNGNDVYIDSDNTLRSKYQLEPGVIYKNQETIENFYDYIDLKNQLKFFGNQDDRDDKITNQTHYTWNPPIDWDKFVNYREYYWEPNGPLSVDIFGQSSKITSTFKVNLGSTNNSFVITPDGYTNNPDLILYRGQTYKFKINAPAQGFSIKINYDSSSLQFRPFYAYPAGSKVIYNNKLWKAIENISATSEILIIDQWQELELTDAEQSLEYNKGVTNNSIESGTLTFVVPYDAPNQLFYQGLITPDCFGKFIIANVEENTFIDVEKEILGKENYKSSNDVNFTNGLKIEFKGKVFPAKYANTSWIVEGVGSKISLTQFSELIVPVITSIVPEVLFDNEGFDTEPFDDASAYPTFKDYITIAKNSVDANPWSRYNRWVHRSVLEDSYKRRNRDFPALEATRAKRPIIEFTANLQLFNHGAIAKQPVDYVDTTTLDIFSTIEGSIGYSVDGEFLFEGARLLVISDTDQLVNNKIFQVEFIVHNGTRQIHLAETDDSFSALNECVLVKRGNKNSGKMFHFDGNKWNKSQEKLSVNQPPKFDVFDNNGVSFSDSQVYPTSTFYGSQLLSYKVGNGVVDSEVGIRLSYLNINNVGDIQFMWDWEVDSFSYIIDRQRVLSNVDIGFYKVNPDNEYLNGWTIMSNDYIQPIVDSQAIVENTNRVTFNTINWNDIDNNFIINFYLNGIKCNKTYTQQNRTFIFDSEFSVNDIISVKIVNNGIPDQGYYEIPIGLEKNPLNANLTTFTLGQANNHVFSAFDFTNELIGNIPGNSNLRDLQDYKKHAKRFVKHATPAPVAFMGLCDKTHNIIKALQYSRKSYTEFKNNFLIRATTIDYNDDLNDFVDDIINSLTKTKNESSAFFDSDMIGSGAYNSLVYNVEDTGIRTFALATKFDLLTTSKIAVYVYLNGKQLLNSKDYTFNSVFGFISLLVNLNENDSIEIREYSSTSSNHIPPTPTSIGLYKKYTPMKFLDDTYVEPRMVIQGHDGSTTLAFDDYRDDLLLELEYRIYNNIKREYREDIFNIDATVGSYYYADQYSKQQQDDIVSQEFLKWIQNSDINFTSNPYFDRQNSFTYNYSNMSDPTRMSGLPGYWRGVYQWFYDTTRPHTCPWEILGFSQQPSWWETLYGPAPYTKNNLILWEDIRDGIVREGSRAGTYPRYARPSIMDHIPVDESGRLLSPLESGLAQDFSLINNGGLFKLGDIAPAEYAWRASSEWPFTVAIAMCLLKPFDFISSNFNLLASEINQVGQHVNPKTKTFITVNDLNITDDPLENRVGLVKYLISYVKSLGISEYTISSKLKNLDVALSHRMSGFVDQDQQKFLLDSKSPSATSSSIFLPPENYDIIFNVSSPITSISYSGVILEKVENGWEVTGYDNINPYFNVHRPVTSSKDPVISVGGVSETFINWIENKNYNNGSVIRFSNNFYRALRTHNSGDSFDSTVWKKLPSIPVTGAVEALRRRVFNTLSVNKIAYGTLFSTIQQVVNFLLGHESYLKSVGFKFDRYDPENKVSQDWLTTCKEFMFWTKHNWEFGSLISLSPSAQKVDISFPVGVADNMLDGFYDYQVLKTDRNVLPPEFINVTRTYQNTTIEPVNTTDGIYFLTLNYVLKEHVTIFDDKTLFNDVIYDKTTGYRQDRIKVRGFRTVDWDGDYTSPGFIFDNVNIAVWQPFTDYKLGDIVSYRAFNWTSLSNHLGTEKFNISVWSKLDSIPSKQLISNFDYKINQFADYFDVSSDGIEKSQRELARHTIGYQQREYLQNLSEDPVTQFQLYQGFIREKGTANAITKVFDKLSVAGSSSIVLNEEWAFRVGQLGGTAQLSELEIVLKKDKFNVNPQSISVLQNSSNKIKNFTRYEITSEDFLISQTPFNKDINPVSLESEPFNVAGYVNTTQVDFAIASRADLTNLDIFSVNENAHIWVTFDNSSWSVLRVNHSQLLQVVSVDRSADTEITLELSQTHAFAVDDYVGFRDFESLTGFFKISKVGVTSITVEVFSATETPLFDESTIINLQILTECRIREYQDIDTRESALLKDGSKIFVDLNENGLWEVVEKIKQFSAIKQSEYGTNLPQRAGAKVVYDSVNRITITSMPGSSLIVCYSENNNALVLKQLISPPGGSAPGLANSFGEKMAISTDGKFLVIASPLATINSNYLGNWDPTAAYSANDIVLYAGRLWKAKNFNLGDGSTQLAIHSDDWQLADNIPASISARGPAYLHQGMISIYEYKDNRYQIINSFVSPRPTENERFGAEVAISLAGNQYTIAVSATGSYGNAGRVYFYTSDNRSLWTHAENNKYAGIYNASDTYYIGDIVWQSAQENELEGSFWSALETITTGNDIITIDDTRWEKVNNIATNCFIPTNIAIDNDGSTIDVSLTTDSQLIELVRPDDYFGHSIAMNSNGSILAVGAPYSDNQYFPNYRGIWNPLVSYNEFDVVQYTPSMSTDYFYYKLVGEYSSEPPNNSENWEEISSNQKNSSGKVFIYNKTLYGSYQLIQTISADTLVSPLNELQGIIRTGDQLGFALDISASGNTLVISSPKADINLQDQGSVYVFNKNSETGKFILVQQLESFEKLANEFFGFSVSISPGGEKIAVGARNSSSVYTVSLDLVAGTSFDNNRTTFFQDQGYTGAVYIFDKLDNRFLLTEKLDDNLQANESFGYSVDCTNSVVLVGSPNYQIPLQAATGITRLFKFNGNSQSWKLLSRQSPTVDLRLINSIELYDNINNIKIQDVDYVDSAKGKILNIAEQEIKFKTPYDPAVYSIGTDDVVVDSSVNWMERNVGQLWWNISTVKWIHAEQQEDTYKTGNWNKLVVGASVDIYEWVETPLLPNEWAALADTNEGTAAGISGQPLYPDNDVYSIKELYNAVTGNPSSTLYYYWVKGKVLVPQDTPGRIISSAEVASIISNPIGTGIAFISLIESNKLLAFNFDSVISNDTALLNIQYKKNYSDLRPIHNEYQLLTEGVANSLPTTKLENKWLDSLIGYNSIGSRVPSTDLPAKQKYGISYRPLQSMFVDRRAALKTIIVNTNSILKQQAFSTLIDFSNLNLNDSVLPPILNLYDITVDNEIDLQAVGTARIKQAILKPNIINGQLDTVDILDSGFGYKVVPPIEILGDGENAEVQVELDNQGRISKVSVKNRGKKYSFITIKVRNFAVLVTSDSTLNNFWSIYSWDDQRRAFFRSKSQSFDTRKFWNLVDWFKEGVNIQRRIIKEIDTIGQDVTANVGDLIRVKEYGVGGWAIFEKISLKGDTFLDKFVLVGRELGTIELSQLLYNNSASGEGFDNSRTYDTVEYDTDCSAELRNILFAIKHDIFTGDYQVEWNKLFFTSIRYVLAEQQYVDWVFKTSFLNATHNAGSFTQKSNYKNDNLNSYQEYIDEVKPYSTTVREYISCYSNNEPYNSSVSDFDLPPIIANSGGPGVSVLAGQLPLDQYPWKWWADNNGYSVTGIEVSNPGSMYITAPTVMIEGNGTGATAIAYISGGKVSGISVITSGTGYTKTPTVTLIGGKPSNVNSASAVAILGDSKARTFKFKLKFDRVSKAGDYVNFDQQQTFVASGLTSVFILNYAPTINKTDIAILKNNQLVLNSEYTVHLFYSKTDTYSVPQGKLIFVNIPEAGDVIEIRYSKNMELLTAVNRIEKFYSPSSGMLGKDLNQLMTGIDFGGVQIQGTTFDVTGGWDALPWFTDNWDSVESSSDYYHICEENTVTVTLPYVPALGNGVTIYLKRVSDTFENPGLTTNEETYKVSYDDQIVEQVTIRIDDFYFNGEEDSSTLVNPNALMPTFIGDGVNNVVNIEEYLSTKTGDILIFRPVESDGSVTITDENLLDTRIEGGSLSFNNAYTTATGTTVDEIAILGGEFISKEHVPAPEENVPGQVLDSLSIKVYQSPPSGTAPLQSKIYIATGEIDQFAIGQQVIENNSVIVYVDNIKKMLDIDYTIDFKNYTITFNAAPLTLSLVEILSIGVGGVGLLDYQEFVADGETRLFLTNANYDQTTSVFVTLNGKIVNAGFKNSTDVIDAVGKTLVEFSIVPEVRDVIKIVCIESTQTTADITPSVVKVNSQTMYFEGSTRTFNIENFIELPNASAASSAIVEINGKILKSSDTTYVAYDGITTQFRLAEDPFLSPGTVLSSNITVYVNNVIKEFITDYVFDGPTKILTITAASLQVGDIIKIENNFDAEYSIIGSELTINSTVELESVDENSNVKIDITWFSQYASMDIVADEKTGGKVQYQLLRNPISSSYVWVYLNGQRLVPNKDYYVSLPRGVVYLNVNSTADDVVKTITFGANVFKMPSAFEISKDMLNVYRYNRFSKGIQQLSKQLNYFDRSIEIDNGDELAEPNQLRNIPGTVNINGERIEYMVKHGNILSQLRRGVQGTPIGNSYPIGAAVVDVGFKEAIPYNETQLKTNFISDGSTNIIGPLDFVPAIGQRNNWYAESIPDIYGPCDQIEVFAAGRRLRKHPISVWKEENGATSPAADIQLEAEFSVDGISNNIRLSDKLPAGTRVTVIKRIGKTWYENGTTTASNGVTLLDNNSPIAKFIAVKTTSLPE